MTHDHDRNECRKLFSQLSDYLDGELDAKLCDGVDRHLGDCPPCRAFLESLRRTVGLVKSLEPERLDEATRRRILDDARRMADPNGGNATTE